MATPVFAHTPIRQKRIEAETATRREVERREAAEQQLRTLQLQHEAAEERAALAAAEKAAAGSVKQIEWADITLVEPPIATGRNTRLGT